MKTFWLLLLIVPSAWGETVLHLHTVSYHLDRDDDFNEVNYGLGVRHYTRNTSFDYLTVGGFKNSEHRPSYYAGIGWEKPLYKKLKGGFIVGAITGYEKYDPAPLIAGTLSIEPITVVIAPYPGKEGEDVTLVFHATVTVWRF